MANKAKFPGKNLSGTQTCTGGGVKHPSGIQRGSRQDPPSGGAQFPGKGLSSSQTRNSLTTRR